ncbi:hypothetical protein BBP40_008458 [Aspergillus hancockii]|nr:hypothetical protein BBP40_008458 [Aspergillus hancockii]
MPQRSRSSLDCRRYRNWVWRAEALLYPLLLVLAIPLPVGLGLFGATLQHHLHYIVLALAVLLTIFSEIALFPIITNYVVECFTDHAAEVMTILNLFRLILGLAVPFLIDPWEARVGPGWCLV